MVDSFVTDEEKARSDRDVVLKWHIDNTKDRLFGK